MSKYSAIVCISDTVDLDSLEALELMPIGLQKTVRGRQQGQLRQLTRGGRDFTTYLVWGSAQDLADADELWGADLIVMDTWSRGSSSEPACRAGFAYINEEQPESTPENPVFLKVRRGQEVRPRDPEIMGLLPDVVRHDVDGVEISRTAAVNFDHLPIKFGHGKREL